jgi:hypothetical protein
MGITKSDCTVLFYSKKLGVSFEETLMLGRLQLFATKAEIAGDIQKYKTNVKEIKDVHFTDEYAEPLFELLGAKKVDSMDFSAYEHASILHDLNYPIDETLKNRFTAIVDGGTIEHVFNFPVAIKNCMNALKIGGHYIGITPANNTMGHGFYQFSPELYYRVFSPENGFEMKRMLICIEAASGTQWYEVADPKLVKSRVMLVNHFPISLILIAEKVAEKNVFETIPQQSDYATIWNAGESVAEKKLPRNTSELRLLFKKLLPPRIRTILRNAYEVFFVTKVKDEFLGDFDSNYFIKTEL